MHIEFYPVYWNDVIEKVQPYIELFMNFDDALANRLSLCQFR